MVHTRSSAFEMSMKSRVKYGLSLVHEGLTGIPAAPKSTIESIAGSYLASQTASFLLGIITVVFSNKALEKIQQSNYRTDGSLVKSALPKNIRVDGFHTNLLQLSERSKVQVI